MWRRKRSKYFDFNWTQIISDWRLVQNLHRSKVRVGMLVFLSRGRWARTTPKRTWPRRCFAASPHIRSEVLAIGRDFQQILTWWLPKGSISSFGVFNFQRLQEIFSVQSWCAAIVNLKNQRLFSKRRWAWWGSKSLTHQKRRKSEGFCCQVPSNPA